MSHLVRIDERLWNTAVAPEGLLEWWFRADGDVVEAGDKLAEVDIEGARHEITAPARGRLKVFAFAGYIVDPGSVIGCVG